MSRGGPGGPRAVDPLRGTRRADVRQRAAQWALHHQAPATIGLARGLSWFGQTNVVLPLVILAGVAAAVETRRFARVRAGGLLVGVGSVGVATGLGINRATGRIRPPLARWAGAAGGFGFPSGHTTAATVAAGLIG